MASRAPVAAVLLRGPSAWYHLVAWDTARDTFEHGAWFKGRIYEERCDVSPDGELFLYFALKGRLWGASYRGTWTAVSRLPWLNALALWPQGDTWSGGGYFDGERSVVLQTCSLEMHPAHRASGLEARSGFGRVHRPAPDVAGAQWSGHDQSGATVFSRGGRLYRVVDDTERELADFNGLSPAPQPAPDWATAPLQVVSSRKRRKTLRRRSRAARKGRRQL